MAQVRCQGAMVHEVERGALADILGCRGPASSPSVKVGVVARATCVTTWSEVIRGEGGQSDERSTREAKFTPRRG